MISRKTPEPRLDRASQIGTFVAYKILSDYVEGKTDVDVGDTRATNTIIQQKVREEMLGEWGFWRLRHPRAAPATEREIEEAERDARDMLRVALAAGAAYARRAR